MTELDLEGRHRKEMAKAMERLYSAHSERDESRFGGRYAGLAMWFSACAVLYFLVRFVVAI